MVEGVFKDCEHRMKGAIENLRRELATLRTGRASPALLERIQVDYYGTPTPINQLGNVSTPEPRMLVIQPWDKSTIGPIEKAIQKSDLGINPSNDGSNIRLVMPQLTEERRKDMVKLVHKRVEEGRVAIRNCRRDGVDKLKKQEKDKTITEDDSKRMQEQLQKLTDQWIAEAERVGKTKETEILEV